jgi:HAD superfamily hydrolase (TIGR01509 family)
MNSSVRDNPDRQRYEILVDDSVGAFTEYRLHGWVADFVHTETLPSYRRRGLASRLIPEALDDARRRDWKVRPVCPFVCGYIAKHSEYLDLVPAEERAAFGLSVMTLVEAVIFDLDGVILHSEEIWDWARQDVAVEQGVTWPPDATQVMMGMSSLEWSRYMHDDVGIPLTPETISAEVVRRVEERYRRAPPWIDGALTAVRRIGARWPLGLASSSNREVIDLILERGQLRELFAVTVSSEEVAAGKPAPDVYLEAARRLRTPPERCAAVEDSTNGLLSAQTARMRVIAIPNAAHPPAQPALRGADVVLPSIADLTPAVVVG